MKPRLTYVVVLQHEGSAACACLPSTRKEAVTRAKAILNDSSKYPTLHGVIVMQADTRTWRYVGLPCFTAYRSERLANLYGRHKDGSLVLIGETGVSQ